MAQEYSDPLRENDPHALPDIEITYWSAETNADFIRDYPNEEGMEPGWYWQPCFPGCLPDGEPVGPFDTYEEALADAREE